MEKSARNLGIDLLRIFSIFLVTVLHVLGHGGVLSSASSLAGFSVSWFLEILALPAVNCFVLISGFVGYKGEKYFPNLRNLISIFFTVLFYSVAICLLIQLISPEIITLQNIKDSFRPLIKGQYWFYSAYFGMFLITPILNAFVYNASKKQLYLAALVVAAFSIFSLETDSLTLGNGYSVIWFSFVYLLGAICKKQNIPSTISAKTCVIAVLVCLGLTWLPKVFLTMPQSARFGGYADYFISYTSPTVLLMAIFWLCLFSRFKFNRFFAALIPFFSSSAFSVYLIHDNRHLRNLFMIDRFSFVHNYSFYILPFIIIGAAVAILVSCTLIDKIRLVLFRLVAVDKICAFIDRVIRGAVNKVYLKLCNK